jgi:thioredoxin-like negative regulator of GroEL
MATPSESYAEAHRQTVETGRPMVVMVGAEWCPACKAMEANVLPEMRSRGLLRRVAFALVDMDRDGEIGHKLVEGGPIPQLIVFRKTSEGWKNRRLIGNQSIEAVEEFISQNVSATEAKHAPTKAAASKQKAKPQGTVAKDQNAMPPIQSVSHQSAVN